LREKSIAATTGRQGLAEEYKIGGRLLKCAALIGDIET